MSEQRYYTQSGANPEVKFQLTIAGPQSAEQVPEEVRKLLDNPNVTSVMVECNYGVYPSLTSYSKIKEPE